MRRYVISIVLTIISSSLGFSQVLDQYIQSFNKNIQSKAHKSHYFFVDAGGGYHKLVYQLTNGSPKGQAGYLVDAGYGYLFSNSWSIETGLGLESFATKGKVNFMTETNSIDADGDSYVFRIYYQDWEEKQHAIYLNIPLNIQYQPWVSRKNSLLFKVGCQLAIPVQAGYETTSGQIATTGYYSQWNVELSGMQQHGFYTYEERFARKLSFKTIAIITADIGTLFTLNENSNFFISGYFHYGLSEVATGGTVPLYQMDGTYNGMLSSNLVKNVKPMAIGIKTGVSF